LVGAGIFQDRAHTQVVESLILQGGQHFGGVHATDPGLIEIGQAATRRFDQEGAVAEVRTGVALAEDG